MIKRKLFSSLAAVSVAALLILLLIFEDRVSSVVEESLRIAARQVLPSLFPYMVLSSVMISLDLLRPLYSLISTEKLFRLPRCASQVMLCGLLCGFPIGTAGSARLCMSGQINKRQAAVLCAVSSHTSPAFLIGTVGNWWGDGGFGVFLYLMEVLFCLLSGVLLSRIMLPVIRGVDSGYAVPSRISFPAALCSAVHDASHSCLSITGYIVFFRVAAALFSSVIPTLAPLFITSLEFSSGAAYGSSLGGIRGAAVTGLAVGFSGAAVLMQCCNFTVSEGISMKCYSAVKLTEGAFLSFCAAAYVAICPLTPAKDTFSPCGELDCFSAAVSFLLLCASFLVTSLCRKRNNFTHGY